MDNPNTTKAADPKDVLVPCPVYRGTKVQELNGGLHTRPCPDCKGSGKAKPETRDAILNREKEKEAKAQQERDRLQAAMKVNRAPVKPVTQKRAPVAAEEAEEETVEV